MSRPPPLSAFTLAERRIVAALRTPSDVQRWLSSLPYNRELRAETARSLRGVVRHRTAHCFEAALSAATILEQHGYPPTMLVIESQDGLDHVLLTYRRRGRYGTVARSRDPGLHGRWPVFGSVRELVASYADPYVDLTGRIVGYGTLDLRELPRNDWRLSTRNLRYVEEALLACTSRRFNTPERRYRELHAKYGAFKKRFPDRKPVLMYASRNRWMGWPRPRSAPHEVLAQARRSGGGLTHHWRA